jgi:HSP20 family molecular chaperone IbpA
VTITHGILNVKISRQKNVERDLGTFYHREERLFAERRRSIKLPENSDCDHAIAELKHGILTVTLPKVATIVKMKSIPLIRG